MVMIVNFSYAELPLLFDFTNIEHVCYKIATARLHSCELTAHSKFNLKLFEFYFNTVSELSNGSWSNKQDQKKLGLRFVNRRLVLKTTQLWPEMPKNED